MKVAILSHNRPHYLKQVLDSVKEQTYQDFEIFLFQDGVVNAYSWRKTAYYNDVFECVTTFKEMFPASSVYESEGNIGICENWRKAEHTMFINKGFNEVLFLEDDLVLSKHYFQTIANMFDTFRDDPSIGFFNAYSENKEEGNDSEMKKMGHLWSYGTTKESWQQRQSFFDKYYEIVSGKDYAYRPVDKIYELYNDYSVNPNVAHSQDGAKCIAMMLSKQIKVSTSRNLAKYIGAQGFHATQQFYDNMGFADMPMYEDGPITQFNVDKEKIRNELKEEYYE